MWHSSSSDLFCWCRFMLFSMIFLCRSHCSSSEWPTFFSSCSSLELSRAIDTRSDGLREASSIHAMGWTEEVLHFCQSCLDFSSFLRFIIFKFQAGPLSALDVSSSHRNSPLGPAQQVSASMSKCWLFAYFRREAKGKKPSIYWKKFFSSIY